MNIFVKNEPFLGLEFIFTTSDYLERNFCNKRYQKYLFTYFLLKVFQKDFVRGLCKLFVEVWSCRSISHRSISHSSISHRQRCG
jgi:hypothetical protein